MKKRFVQAALGFLGALSTCVWPAVAEGQQDGGDGMVSTCAAPTFALRGWEGPETLVLTVTSETERTFNVDIGLAKAQTEKHAFWSFAPGTVVAQSIRTSKGAPSGLPCRAVKSTDPTAENYENIACYQGLTVKKSGGPTLNVTFWQSSFGRLLKKDGEIHIHYQSDDAKCKIEGWQQITAYDRSVAKIEAGASYVRNSEGAWNTRGEAAVGFTTRWLPFLVGVGEFRYSGLAKTEDTEMTSSQTAAKAGDTTFNPFKSSDGILQANFSLQVPLSRRGVIPSLDQSLIAGFGLSTLRGVTSPTGKASEFSETRPRFFGGFKLSVPRFHISGADEDETHPTSRGSLLVALARDEIWNFADPVVSNGTVGGKNRSNRFVAEGLFEFFKIQTGGTRTPITARIYWDTPSNFNGASDLRISLLAAVNFFQD